MGVAHCFCYILLIRDIKVASFIFSLGGGGGGGGGLYTNSNTGLVITMTS